jgi:hypothetical protein
VQIFDQDDNVYGAEVGNRALKKYIKKIMLKLNGVWRGHCTLCCWGRPMVTRKTPLEDSDFAEIFEREIEEGVHIERTPEFEEDSAQEVLGGLIRTEEHVSVHELPGPDKRKHRR